MVRIKRMEALWNDCVVYIDLLYMCIPILYALIIKLTLSACVWRWSCMRYTWADDVDANGVGEA